VKSLSGNPFSLRLSFSIASKNSFKILSILFLFRDLFKNLFYTEPEQFEMKAVPAPLAMVIILP